MGTVRFLLLWGGLTLCLCLMASAHSQPGHREGGCEAPSVKSCGSFEVLRLYYDRLDSAKKHNSKNGPPGKRRNENKEVGEWPLSHWVLVGGAHTLILFTY
uniref:Uncharacterized protein n=1 Tax=Xenopus tropicalis TaxID=8364 RepID=A0A1B8Y3E5_XENTR